MPMNRIQFQPGLSMSEFFERYGSERQCEAALEKTRWPEGFRCPCYGTSAHCLLRGGNRKTFQCNACRHQTSLIAGTIFQGTKLGLTVWFLAIYLISQAKTGLSALALKRQLGVSYPTAWLIQHKLMRAIAERDERYVLEGQVQVDDAYLRGERSGGTRPLAAPRTKSRSWPPSPSAMRGIPLRVKLSRVPGFTRKAIAAWASTHLAADSIACSDRLACFSAVTEAGCVHQPTVVAGRKPKDLAEFLWINTVLGNLKTNLSGRHHAFSLHKYASRCLAAFTYRFNRRFDLRTLHQRLLVAAAGRGAHPERTIRMGEVRC